MTIDNYFDMWAANRECEKFHVITYAEAYEMIGDEIPCDGIFRIGPFIFTIA